MHLNKVELLGRAANQVNIDERSFNEPFHGTFHLNVIRQNVTITDTTIVDVIKIHLYGRKAFQGQEHIKAGEEVAVEGFVGHHRSQLAIIAEEFYIK